MLVLYECTFDLNYSISSQEFMSRGEHRDIFCKSHVKKSSVPLAILEKVSENWPDGVD